MENQEKPFDQSAYPIGRQIQMCEQGMTLRDHFAGLAMQAILSQPNIGKLLRDLECKSIDDSDKQISITAFRLADEMLKQRSL